ncbi:MAG TPA: YsnF/AvaK domain-containing protein [Candidatus Nitrosocosmicus sp.]|nr:YsnF/AvaK domain-containing protein [Candidatus Nitrosocosmicus sp.]
MPNVVGLFDSRSEAHSTVQQLLNSGFDREDISLVSQDTDRQSNDGKTHPGISGSDLSIPKDDTSGALKGAGIGAALGGIGGLLAGIAGLAIPVIGPIVAAGPIAAALTAALGGAGIGAATGGLIGALTDMGVPEDEAKHYQDQVGRGKTLVVVRASDDDFAERAADILESSGAEKVDGRETDSDYTLDRPSSFGRESQSRDNEISERRTLRDDRSEVSLGERDINYRTARVDESGVRAGQERFSPEDRVIPVTEEQLVVGKRAVQSGRVRIYGRVTEKPVEQSVQLHSERVTIDRRAVDRPVGPGDKSDDMVIEITETKEEPVIGKQERVVEEIVIGKTTEEHTETVRDTLRRKDVELERTGNQERLREEDNRR